MQNESASLWASRHHIACSCRRPEAGGDSVDRGRETTAEKHSIHGLATGGSPSLGRALKIPANGRHANSRDRHCSRHLWCFFLPAPIVWIAPKAAADDKNSALPAMSVAATRLLRRVIVRSSDCLKFGKPARWTKVPRPPRRNAGRIIRATPLTPVVDFCFNKRGRLSSPLAPAPKNQRIMSRVAFEVLDFAFVFFSRSTR